MYSKDIRPVAGWFIGLPKVAGSEDPPMTQTVAGFFTEKLGDLGKR